MDSDFIKSVLLISFKTIIENSQEVLLPDFWFLSFKI